jgi:hypothetical protein
MAIPLADLLETCRRSPQDLKLGEVLDLVHAFGPLASWWLDGMVLERAFEGRWHRPSLPATAGSCWVVFAQDTPPSYPCLAGAYLLPVEWRQHAAHSSRLPAKLIDLVCSVTKELGAKDWGLHLSAEAGLDAVDLAAAEGHLEFKSGWAALAGGLVVARDGGKPDPAVWATGRWEGDPAGIRPVGHLDAKIALAAAHGVRHFFVPSTQVAEAERLAAGVGQEGPRIGALEEGTPDARAALRAYRRRLRTRPGRSDPRSDRRDYYLSDLDPQEEKDFYRENLLPDILESIREQWLAVAGEVPVSHLVTIASDNPALVALAAGAIRPTRCLVLCTPDKEAQRQEAFDLAKAHHLSGELIPQQFQDVKHMLAEMAGTVQCFVAGASASEVVLDLTPGSKEMSLMLALEVAQPGNRLYYLRHDRQGPKVVPFRERPLVWQVAGAGTNRSRS